MVTRYKTSRYECSIRALASALALVMLGCASAGDLNSKAPLSVSLDTLGPIYVLVKTRDKDWSEFATKLESRIVEGLMGEYPNTKVAKFAKGVKDGSVIRIELVDYFEGNWILRTFPFFGFLYPPNSGGETKFESKGQIINLKTRAVLSDFELESDSSDWNSHAPGGRVVANIVGNSYEDRMNRTAYAAVEELRLYLGKVKPPAPATD